MIRKKIIGLVAIATIGGAILAGSHGNIATASNNIANSNKHSINTELLSGPVNYSNRLANYVSSAANRRAAWNEAVGLHNGSEMDNCTLWVSSCLRGSGLQVPDSIAYTTYLAKWLLQHNWQQKFDLDNLKRGDICFASNTHAFIFLSWYNKSEHLANVVDEQAAFFTPNAPSYVRNLDGTHGNGWVPGDTEANDSYGAATYYMTNYPTGQAISTNSTGWKSYEGNWYYNNNNNELATGWEQVNGSWYYFNANGAMQTGWQELNGSWYYFDQSGAMQTGWLKTNGSWHYLNSSGELVVGWAQINGYWFHFDQNGIMQTGWQKINGSWYYLTNTGAMQTGWSEINGYWFYFNQSGAMQKGWNEINGSWYYLTNTGAMQTGWSKIEGYWFFFDQSGAMQKGWQKINGSWYYLTNTGAMATGSYQVNGTDYVFNNSGQLM